ncbi:MAG: YIP1 family protein [Simkaniaceae bacterium]|nr:YIP1 family protein [Simkaniaceae bacterium]
MSQIPGMNPWLNIWTRPRETIRAIVSHNNKYRILALSAIYGFLYLIHALPLFTVNKETSVFLPLLLALILAIPVGWIAFSVYSLFIFWVGKLLKGKASYYDVRAAVSWANVPNAVNICVILLYLGFFGEKIYCPDAFSTLSIFGMNAALIFVLIQLVFGLWAFFLLLHTLGEVQKFSAWKALLNIALMSILLGVVMIGGLMLIGFITQAS